jgi:hypothetical protein
METVLKVRSICRVFIAGLSTSFYIGSLRAHPNNDNLLVGKRFVQIAYRMPEAVRMIPSSIIVITTVRLQFFSVSKYSPGCCQRLCIKQYFETIQ